jgi:Pyrimidine dimer DNA glycosylase
MQTFLPYRDFARSAEVLDAPRLGKQRVETLQVLRALELGDYGWRNHPVVHMWRSRTPALVAYGLAVVRAWQARGHADSTYELITEFAPEVEHLTQADLAARGLLPTWLGDRRLHLSHRSALIRKDPAFYRPVFGDVPDDLPYYWPSPDEPAAPDAATPADAEDGPPLWVVRAPDPDTAQDFLDGGYVALAQPGPRAAKLRRQVEAFTDQVAPGDLVALPLDGGRFLAVGEVLGGHREEAGRLPHRRDVRWFAELPRGALRAPAQLQDPRTLFRVRLVDPVAEHPVAEAVSGGTAGAPGRRAG